MENRLDDQLCFALYAASRSFTRAYAPLLAGLGLTYPQYLVMLVLWERDDVSVRELGDRLALDSGTLTPLLKRLEEAGHIQRSRDPADERVVRVRLTTSGKRLRSKASKVPEELACRAGFEPTKAGMAELARLRETLKELTRRLDASVEGTSTPPRKRT